MASLTTRMWSHTTRSLLNNLRKLYMDKINTSFSQRSAKVSVLGAAGGIGQPLSLLLKLNPLVKELAIVDVMNIDGMALDLSHINTSCQVSGYEFSNLEKAVEHSDIIVISAGIPRKPGMTRDDLFKTNADIIGNIILKLIKVPIVPYIAIITNPVNSIVPFAGQLLELRSDPISAPKYLKKLFGVTCLDSTRASTFYASYLIRDPSEISVPVIGGHSDTTMLPLFSQSSVPLTDELVVKDLVQQVKEAGTNVVKAKKGSGSATLSMAYAASTFVNTLLEAHHGNVSSECAFVRQDPFSNKCKYFADMCVFNETGLEKILSYDHITPYESRCLDEIKSLLEDDIRKGEEYAREYDLKQK